jgi:hypothetical protein
MYGTIFVYGNDAMLVTTRRLIFEKAGYTVFTALGFSNAMLVLMNHQINVFLLCQSLSDEERRGILETAHTLQPGIKCALLGFEGREVAMDGADVRQRLDGPATLLAAIGKMLTQQKACGSPV